MHSEILGATGIMGRSTSLSPLPDETSFHSLWAVQADLYLDMDVDSNLEIRCNY